jgi:hypothetical protein
MLALLAAGMPAALHAQAQAASTLAPEQLQVYAKAYVAIGQVRDSIHAELAQTRNKTAQAQTAIQEKMRQQIEHVLHEHGLTQGEYQRRTLVVSVEPDTRKAFDELVAQLTGQPAPGQQNTAPAAATPRPAREGATTQESVRAHIDHVLTSFSDTPNRQGLLPTALAEARIATQHAALAARTPDNLDVMKLHAGHVLHAIDPTAIERGPGLGYGVKKAAGAIAAHIEMAAKATGAPAAVAQHAVHVATSAKNTVTRADRIAALVRELQAATTAAAAAALLNQIVPLTEQLISGADANADGRITWQDGEGGLQHAGEHLDLMVRG